MRRALARARGLGPVLGALALVAALPAAARAFEAFDAQAFEAPTDPDAYITVDGARAIEGHPIGFHAAVYFSYARDPVELRVREDGGRESIDIVEDLPEFALVLGVGLFDRLSLGVAFPFVTHRDGTDIEDPTEDLKEEGVGALRAEAKLTVVKPEADDLLGLALKAFVKFPTGAERDFESDAEQYTFGALAILELYLGAVRLGLNAGVEYIGVSIRVADTVVDTKLRLGAGIALDIGRLTDDEGLEGLELVGEVRHFARWEKPYDQEEESPVEIGGAIKYSGTLFALAGASAGLNEGVTAPDWRIFVAIGVTLGGGGGGGAAAAGAEPALD